MTGPWQPAADAALLGCIAGPRRYPHRVSLRALVVACIAAAACGRIDFTTTGNPGTGGAGPDPTGSDDGPPPAAACGVVQDTSSAPIASWNGISYGLLWYDGAGPGLNLQRVAGNGGRIGTPALAVPESMSGFAGVLATARGYAIAWLDPFAERVDFVMIDAAGKELTAPAAIGGDRVQTVLFGPPSYGFYVEPMSTGTAVFWMGGDVTDQQTWMSTADATGARAGSDVDLSGTLTLDLVNDIAAHDDRFAILHNRSSNGNGNAILLGQRDPTGALVGAEVTIEPSIGGSAGLAWSGDRYGVAWRHQQGTAIQVTFATYSTTPARLSTPIVLATAPPNGDVLSSVVAWTGQDFVVAWILEDELMNETLQYARIPAGGGPGPTTTVMGARGPLYLTAAGGGGGALLLWTNSGSQGGSFAAVCPGTP